MKYRKRSRWRVIVVLVALYAVVGFFAVPPLVKWQLEKRLTETLERPVSIGQVRTNPFALSLAVNRVVVRVPDGSDTFVQWNRFYVNFDPLASITREWVLGDVALDGLNAALEVRPDGSLNISDLIEKFRQPEASDGGVATEEKSSRPWRIQRLNITDARLDFVDESQAEPFRTTAGPVNLTLLDFRTAGPRGAPGRFQAVSDAGEQVTWIGSLTAVPLTSTGELRIENVLLPKYAPYLAEHLNASITSGRLGVSVNYDVDLSPGNRRLVVTEGTTQLDEFEMKERDGGEPLVAFGSLQVAGISADLLARRVGIEAVRLNEGTLTVRRDADGGLNWLDLLPAGEGAVAAPAATTSQEPLDLTVKEVSLRDFAVAARDLSTRSPVEANLTRINGSVKNATLAPGAAMPVELSFDWAPRGAVRVSGSVIREPLVADLELEVAWVALPPLSPYLEDLVKARVARGAASMNGRAQVALKEGLPPEVTFSGGARVEDFSVVAEEGGEELAGFSQFAVNDVKLSTTPRTALSIAEVNLGSPRAQVTMNEEGGLNFAELMRAPAGGTSDNAEAEAEVAVNVAPATGNEDAASGLAAMDITVSRVLIAGGEVTFHDRSSEPQVRAAVSQFGGTLRNLSSQRPELGSIEVRAVVNGAGAVTAIGRFNPLGAQPFADLIVEVNGIDLTPAGPYVSRFAGYELETGRLFVDTKAKLADERLDLQNTVTLEQFVLGRATPGPDAVKMPVKLGVALLKDSEGKIVLNLPVQGSLNDPKFDMGAAVSGVLTGLLTKAATSPFSLLGSMFGGGGEELAEQEWIAGEATLTEDSVRRLVTVQRALAARPALSVEIQAGYDPRADAEAMKRGKLDELLRRELVRESGGAGPTAEQRAAAIRRVFAETFPGGVATRALPLAGTSPAAGLPSQGEAGSRTEAAASVEAREREERENEDERRGIIRRAFDMATLKGAREWWGDRRERKEREEMAERAESERRRVVEREAAERAEADRLAAAGTSGAQAVPAALSVEEMERHLAETVAVSTEDLAELARARAERVRQMLLADGQVAAERLTIATTQPDAPKPQAAKSVLHLR